MTNEQAINIAMQEVKREMADRKNDTLIIKCEVILNKSELEAWRKTIQKQMDEGIVLLPWYLTPMLVPEDVAIKIGENPGYILRKEEIHQCLQTSDQN